jgi:serine/threonine protein kinase
VNPSFSSQTIQTTNRLHDTSQRAIVFNHEIDTFDKEFTERITNDYLPRLSRATAISTNLVPYNSLYYNDKSEDYRTFLCLTEKEPELISAFLDTESVSTLEQLIYAKLQDQTSSVFSEAEIRHTFSSILRGLQTLHQYDLTHNNITPRNILFLANSRILLSNYGIGFEKIIDLLTENELYLAPEVIEQRIFSAKSDLYAAAVILLKMLTLKDVSIDYEDENFETTLRNEVLSRYGTSVTSEFSDLIDLIIACVREDEITRPDIDIILELIAVRVEEVVTERHRSVPETRRASSSTLPTLKSTPYSYVPMSAPMQMAMSDTSRGPPPPFVQATPDSHYYHSPPPPFKALSPTSTSSSQNQQYFSQSSPYASSNVVTSEVERTQIYQQGEAVKGRSAKQYSYSSDDNDEDAEDYSSRSYGWTTDEAPRTSQSSMRKVKQGKSVRVKKRASIKKETDEVKEALSKNLAGVLERGEKLQDLVNQSEDISSSASQFRKSSKKSSGLFSFFGEIRLGSVFKNWFGRQSHGSPELAYSSAPYVTGGVRISDDYSIPPDAAATKDTKILEAMELPTQIEQESNVFVEEQKNRKELYKVLERIGVGTQGSCLLAEKDSVKYAMKVCCKILFEVQIF